MNRSRILIAVASAVLWRRSRVTPLQESPPAASPEFASIVPADAKVEKLAGDFQFVEGPVWMADDAGGHLLFSDIPANRILKWTKADGVTEFRAPSHQTNGNTLDREGRLISCEHATRRVTRTEPDGRVQTIADRFEGKKFNAPNDAVVKSDGSVWFTDPPYGGHKDLEQGANRIYRVAPRDRTVTAIGTVEQNPNGLCFSPDESKLYVADSGQSASIFVFDVTGETVGDRKLFAKLDNGAPDGIRCDADGRVWSSAGDGVHVFSPEGKLLGKVITPEAPANLCFGGPDGKTLFMTARTGLYAINVNATGASRPRRK